MTRRERLMATLRGEPVDRPPVSFYEINGLDERPDDPDPFNIFSHPSWQPLITLAREKTDLILMRGVGIAGMMPNPVEGLSTSKSWIEGRTRYTVQTVRAGSRTLTCRSRRDMDVNTVWSEEHLLKDVADLEAFLDIPAQTFSGTPNVQPILDTEARLGDRGIVMIDGPDPLCIAASLFSMADYTVVALTEPQLFHRILERYAAMLWPKTEAVARALPGRLWRIYGPEYASPPYLPPNLFHDYVVPYVKPMVEAIQRHSGFARIHSHGRLREILDHIVATGCVGLDPVEPPPQGDVELRYVRERYGRRLVLFGNLEASDIENLTADAFEQKVTRALREGTAGHGRGFVLMPSACPYGRVLTACALRNYERMIEVVERTYGR
ncbi:MAG: methylcobalamin:coenzyme M methyltransferase [Lentisphaerae bacterium ADurb.BinA184]|nr:MAG: methylcobalamin:coenzyme M methyltransferase [Lentisphaerae bacterium ADurb.BinA184]